MSEEDLLANQERLIAAWLEAKIDSWEGDAEDSWVKDSWVQRLDAIRALDQHIAEGLAAYATTYFEMGDAADVARSKVIRLWQRLGSPSGAFGAAAEAVTARHQ